MNFATIEELLSPDTEDDDEKQKPKESQPEFELLVKRAARTSWSQQDAQRNRE